MNFKKSRNKLFFLTIFFAFFAAFIIFQPKDVQIESPSEKKDVYEIRNKLKLKSSDYWNFDKSIIINGTATGVGAHNWTWALSQPWCSGYGNSTHPYLIENVTINGQNSSSCIIIENTIEYFEIRNCTLYNAGPLFSPDYDCGIRVENCSNGNLINNNCSYNNYFGMFLDDCINVLVQGNNLSYNIRQGLFIYFSQDCEIIGNTVTNNIKNTRRFFVRFKFLQERISKIT